MFIFIWGGDFKNGYLPDHLMESEGIWKLKLYGTMFNFGKIQIKKENELNFIISLPFIST
jgi:hypothetical protein